MRLIQQFFFPRCTVSLTLHPSCRGFAHTVPHSASLLYGIFYSFFESTPLVFPKLYRFSLGESGLPFLSALVAILILAPPYAAYWHFFVERPFPKRGFGPQEDRLLVGLVGSCLVIIGLFLYGSYISPFLHPSRRSMRFQLTLWPSQHGRHAHLFTGLHPRLVSDSPSAARSSSYRPSFCISPSPIQNTPLRFLQPMI